MLTTAVHKTQSPKSRMVYKSDLADVYRCRVETGERRGAFCVATDVRDQLGATAKPGERNGHVGCHAPGKLPDDRGPLLLVWVRKMIERNHRINAYVANTHKFSGTGHDRPSHSRKSAGRLRCGGPHWQMHRRTHRSAWRAHMSTFARG